MTGTIIGTGACAASHVMENDDLAQFVDTSDAWITERTGIKRRHIAENETVSSLAVCAAKKALLDAEILADEIGLIIVSTMTPESIMPSTACLVQAAIGASNALCFDLNAACSGFVSAFVTARTYLESKKELYAALVQKGVSSEIVEQVFEEADYGEEDSRQAIEALMRKRNYNPETADAKEKQKMMGYLMRKGFSYQDVRNVLQVCE